MDNEKGNPEALHNVGKSRGSKVKDTFVNQGMPAQALVSEKDWGGNTTKAGSAEKLRSLMSS